MNAKDMNIFVDATARYFETLTGQKAAVGAPFLIHDINKYLLDYTGIIGISGNHKGAVLFTSPKNILEVLMDELESILSQGEGEQMLMDIVGEVCNTISGNVRSKFGKDFKLSVPIVLKGNAENIRVLDVAAIYVIPIIWQRQKANLIINLKG